MKHTNSIGNGLDSQLIQERCLSISPPNFFILPRFPDCYVPLLSSVRHSGHLGQNETKRGKTSVKSRVLYQNLTTLDIAVTDKRVLFLENLTPYTEEFYLFTCSLANFSKAASIFLYAYEGLVVSLVCSSCVSLCFRNTSILLQLSNFKGVKGRLLACFLNFYENQFKTRILISKCPKRLIRYKF